MNDIFSCKCSKCKKWHSHVTKYKGKYIDSAGKHRYVYLRGERWIKNLMYNQIKDKIKGFPKLAEL